MGKKLTVGENDLASVNPDLASEWDFERNAPLTPEQVTVSSGKKAFWLCPRGHSYEAVIANRNAGRGCAYCSGRAVLAGFNDLATVNPDLASEWDFEGNAPLTPQEVSPSTGQKVSWLCPSGHSFVASVHNRSRGTGCPACAGQIIFVGENDLATVNPDLASEWDFERNAPLTPQEVMAGSNKQVFWICPAGHSYKSQIASRSGGNGCAYCSGKAVLAGYNDLAFKNPVLASEWDFERNAPLTPEQVTVSSGKKAFWFCEKGHSYRTEIRNRTNGVGCSVCASKTVLAGFNDLATVNPVLASEWDFECNAPLTPEQVTAGSKRKVFWLCPEGHSFEAEVNKRQSGTACPICAGQKVLAGFNDLATVNPDLASEWDFERNAPLTPEQVSGVSGQKAYWLCPEGHSYLAEVRSRSYGTGCPSCASYGYDALQEGLLYFIKSKTLSARKIGITNTNRKYDRLGHYGSEWEVVKTYSNPNGQVIRDLETALLRWLRKDLGLPVYLGKEEMGRAGGHSETFGLEGPSDTELIQKIEDTLFLLTNRAD